MTEIITLLLIGCFVGTYASLVGIGGGIALVPVLLLMYHQSPQGATGISLAVMFFNAVSASVAYGRKQRICYRTGLFFALGAIPGGVLGALTVSSIPQALFNGIFGTLLILMAVFILLKPEKRWGDHDSDDQTSARERCYLPWRLPVCVLSGFAIGFMGALLGIGGGIFYVPVCIYLLGFRVQEAVATSLFVIAIMTLGGAMTHYFNGVFTGYYHVIGLLAAGIILGAQIGTGLSDRMKSRHIIRFFAMALLVVGIRLLLKFI